MKFRSLALLSALLFAAGPLWAQTTDARALLEASSKALAESGSGSASWVLGGIAPSGMFAKLKPSGSGTLEWVRDGQTSAVRFEGRANRAVDAEFEPVDFAFSAGKVTMLLQDQKSFVERDPNARPHPKMTIARKLMRDFWVEERPFAFEIDNATEITLGDPATAGGEACQVVEVRLPEMTPEQKKALPRKSSNLVRIYIAKSDNLPRKIEFINENPILTIGETLELNDLQTGLMLTASDVLHTLPEGWRLDSTLIGDLRTKDPRAKTPASTTQRPEGTQTTTQTPVTIPRPTPRADPRPTAVDFSFETEDGRTIDNASQRGRVTVLYFWGSWSIACKEFGPMISHIAANAAEAPIDVFGLAVRERSPAAARAAIADNNYAYTLVLGADDLASKFRVRIYPTIVVLDKEGRVVKSVRAQAGKAAEQIMTDITNAVSLASSE